jgi:ATP-dependent Lhr-like helicase
VGRWSLLKPPDDQHAFTPTERLKALAEQLLARHGVLTRPAVMAEGFPGGFATFYPVLKALEDTGRIRRGYFVSGLGGSQFAQIGALDRLRALRDAASDEAPAVVLAATDPANPYGAALPWPAEAGRPQRAAGAHVVLVDGALAAYLGRGEGDITAILPAEEPARSRTARALAQALVQWATRTGRGSLGWRTAGDEPLARSPLAPYLRDAGFLAIGPGFHLKAPPAAETADPGENEAAEG